MSGIKITLKYLLMVCILGCFTHSCTIINPKEPTPTYVHIDSFAWDHATPTHGLSTSFQVNTVWAYYNNSPIGEFDLPATIPVITNGTGQLSFYPGIVVSGQNNFNTKYPFYVPDTFTIAAHPGEVINHTPKTSFYSAVSGSIIADFGFGINFGIASGSVGIGLSGTDASLSFDGSQSGVIKLNAATNDTLSEDSTKTTFTIPLGVQSYIELNYKNTVPFYLGLRANVGGVIFYKSYLVGVAPSSTWKKFYFAVADFAGQYKGDNYTLFIRTSLDPGVATGQVLLDNIQLVHF